MSHLKSLYKEGSIGEIIVNDQKYTLILNIDGPGSGNGASYVIYYWNGRKTIYRDAGEGVVKVEYSKKWLGLEVYTGYENETEYRVYDFTDLEDSTYPGICVAKNENGMLYSSESDYVIDLNNECVYQKDDTVTKFEYYRRLQKAEHERFLLDNRKKRFIIEGEYKRRTNQLIDEKSYGSRPNSL